MAIGLVPESTLSSLLGVFLLLYHLFCSFIITMQPFQRKKYHIDMFSSEINETGLGMFTYGHIPSFY